MPKIIANHWANNIRHLRRRKHLSQDEMAFSLGVSRSKLNAHENGQTINPTVDDLVSFSNYFKLSIDNLIKTDLAKLSELKLRELEAGNDTYTKGTQLRILATTVTPDNKDNIEFVSQRAKAGYLTGYSDPDYINKLPVFNMPHLPQDRKYRMFPTVGDSMYPIPENAMVVGKYIDDWSSIKDETPCLVITKDDGIVFKLVTNQIKSNRSLHLASLNSLYEPYEVPVENVIEIWQFVNYIADSIPQQELSLLELSRTVQEMKVELKKLAERK